MVNDDSADIAVSGFSARNVPFSRRPMSGFRIKGDVVSAFVSGFKLKRYRLVFVRPCPIFVVISPICSSCLTMRLAWRSLTLAFDAIRSIDGQHKPLSLAWSASARATSVSDWFSSVNSQTAVMIFMDKAVDHRAAKRI